MIGAVSAIHARRLFDLVNREFLLRAALSTSQDTFKFEHDLLLTPPPVDRFPPVMHEQGWCFQGVSVLGVLAVVNAKSR